MNVTPLRRRHDGVIAPYQFRSRETRDPTVAATGGGPSGPPMCASLLFLPSSFHFSLRFEIHFVLCEQHAKDSDGVLCDVFIKILYEIFVAVDMQRFKIAHDVTKQSVASKKFRDSGTAHVLGQAIALHAMNQKLPLAAHQYASSGYSISRPETSSSYIENNVSAL